MNSRKIAGLRWYIALLLCLASGLNYFDRQTLSVLAHTIQDELKLTTAHYADITSAFLLSYTIMYAVCGRLVDRLGTRRSFTIFVSGWSVANMLHGLAQSAAHFMGFRFLLGATEAAHFPAGIRAVTEWFPMRDRAMAVGIFNAGTAVGAALAAPMVSWIALTWGWRSAFVAGGVLGLLWVAVWAVMNAEQKKKPCGNAKRRKPPARRRRRSPSVNCSACAKFGVACSRGRSRIRSRFSSFFGRQNTCRKHGGSISHRSASIAGSPLRFSPSAISQAAGSPPR